MKTITIKLYEWPREKPEGSGKYGVLTKHGRAETMAYSYKYSAWNAFDHETQEEAKDNLNETITYWFKPIKVEA